MFEHDLSFDPTHGYSREQLLAIQPPRPCEGFEAFWRETHEQTMRVPLNLSLARCDRFSDDQFEVFEVYYDSFEGFRVGGWLVTPRGARPGRGVVVSHGYGGRAQPDKEVYGPPAVMFFPCGRGFNLSARSDLPSVSSGHVVHGIEHRDTYLHRGCVADLWQAVSVLLAYDASLEGKIDFIGASFGGGMGALALPWESRYRKAMLEVPSFGHHPLRVTLRCLGSGDSVTKKVQQQPELLETVLPYYDAAVAAGYIRQPVLVVPALFDPAVPPAGQFAVANVIPQPRKIHVIKAGHYEWPGLVECRREKAAVAMTWFSEP